MEIALRQAPAENKMDTSLSKALLNRDKFSAGCKLNFQCRSQKKGSNLTKNQKEHWERQGRKAMSSILSLDGNEGPTT